MGLFESIRGQFIDVIEWIDPSHDTIVYRFERHNNEIKQGAKLTFRPGQEDRFETAKDIMKQDIYCAVRRDIGGD